MVRLIYHAAEHQDRKDAAERERRISELGRNWTVPARTTQSWEGSGADAVELTSEYAGMSEAQIFDLIHQRMLLLSDGFRQHISATTQDCA